VHAQVGMAVFKACGRKVMKQMTKNVNEPSLDYLYACDLAEMKNPKIPTIEELKAGIHDFDFLEKCMTKRANFVHFAAAQKFQAHIFVTLLRYFGNNFTICFLSFLLL
jgi:hypothetical protein